MLNSEPLPGELEKVLLYIRDGSGDLDYTLKEEVGVMKQLLEESGFTVVVATVSGESLSADSAQIVPDMKLSDVEVSDYSGFILPCMHAGASPEKVSYQAIRMVQEAVEAEIPLAVQHAAIIILARAGVLKGRKYAFHTEVNVDDYPDLEGSIYSGKGIVQDDSIIMSGVCPYLSMLYGLDDGTEQLTHALMAAIGERNL